MAFSVLPSTEHSGVRAKTLEQERARELRRAGQPLRQIAATLNVSLASVSTWTRGIKPAAPPPKPPPRPTVTQPGSGPHAEKVCGRCREALPLTAFNRSGDGHQHWCRECFRQYFKARGAKHREQCSRGSKRRRLDSHRLIAELLADSRCADCGFDVPEALEFDHVGVKTNEVTFLAHNGYSPRRVQAEINRCEIVCVNCHRHRTASRAQSWRVADLTLQRKHLAAGERRNLMWIRDLLLPARCADCGVGDFVAFDFDHVGAKSGIVTKMARDGVSLARLQREVEKCEIVCANCHRIRTRRRKREQLAGVPARDDAA